MSVSNSECQVVFYWEAKRSPVTSAFGCVEISWKTLRNDEFTSAASRGTIPSGFTLRLCCFQCSRVWLGVDSAVLTHVTISRWRWASATFKKKIKKSCNSSENRAAPLTRWHKPPTAREGEALKKTWPVLQIDRGVISVRALPGRVNEAFFFFVPFMRPDTSDASFWCGFTVKVAPVRHCREHRRDNYSGIIRGDRLS